MATRPVFFASYLPRLIAAGHSADAARNILRGYGLSFSNQRFDRAFAETLDTMARTERVNTAPINRALQPDEIGRATRPRARGLLVNVEILVEDPHTKEVAFQTWGYRTNRSTVSPKTAISGAIDDWIAAQRTAQALGRDSLVGTPLGGMISSAVMLVGPDDEEE